MSSCVDDDAFWSDERIRIHGELEERRRVGRGSNADEGWGLGEVSDGRILEEIKHR